MRGRPGQAQSLRSFWSWPAPVAAVGCAQLFPQYLFDLPDLLLDSACELFRLAFVPQVRVVGNPPCFFFQFAFRFVERALDLVLRAGFHVFSFERIAWLW